MKRFFLSAVAAALGLGSITSALAQYPTNQTPTAAQTPIPPSWYQPAPAGAAPGAPGAPGYPLNGAPTPAQQYPAQPQSIINGQPAPASYNPGTYNNPGAYNQPGAYNPAYNPGYGAQPYAYPSTGYHGNASQDAVAPAQQQPSPSDQTAPMAGPIVADGMSGSQAGAGCDCGGSSYFDSAACAPARRTNWVVGIRGLYFERDYEDDVGLGYTPGPPAETIFSTDADMEWMGGIEVSLGMRHCNGLGWELVYWGLYPEQGDYTLFNSPDTSLVGLANLDFNFQSVLDIYNAGDNYRVYRDNEINNIELNFLRNGGCVTGRCCRTTSFEWLGGFRFFRFDEDFRFATFTSNQAYPPQVFYDLGVENDLYGVQFGGRSERCLGQRFRVSFGSKVGIYNNHITHTQLIHDGAGNVADITTGAFGGTPYDFESEKDDVAMSGELELALIYQLSACCRASLGYRVLGISGVALAPDQIPLNNADAREVERIDSNGSLLLHGAFLGLERCF
jgi:hypothetical protein